MTERYQAAIDIKVKRMTSRVNRLDTAYLAEWRKDYAIARGDFIRGDINRLQFGECMEALGFRSDALRAEIRDAERDKADPNYTPPNVNRTFRYELKN